ncbi:MAG: hypothetical protein FWD31_13355, partial [Planctomycetaceae bacterium]|nr:hypothetical protein [Planctomycetaceae bacterium]
SNIVFMNSDGAMTIRLPFLRTEQVCVCFAKLSKPRKIKVTPLIFGESPTVRIRRNWTPS